MLDSDKSAWHDSSWRHCDSESDHDSDGPGAAVPAWGPGSAACWLEHTRHVPVTRGRRDGPAGRCLTGPGRVLLLQCRP